MNLQFQKLNYQEQAIKSVLGVLHNSSLIYPKHGTAYKNIHGIDIISNNTNISKQQLLKNVNKIQFTNHLQETDHLMGDKNNYCPQFNIEMETGTGKTFVYLKSILAINQRYGYKKFIIVVPSVAIREGVIKTLQETYALFHNEFNGIMYDYFNYNPLHDNKILDFAQSSDIEIMIITTQSFNKRDNNKIYQENERFKNMSGMELISSTHPIFIYDEPQSYDNGKKTQSALAKFKPFLAFRYSATPNNKSYPMIYKLGPVTAYKKQLVKQIEVDSVNNDDFGNIALFRLKDVSVNKSGIIGHAITYYSNRKGFIYRKRISIHKGTNMYFKTHLPIYKNMGIVLGLNVNKQSVHFSGVPTYQTVTQAEELNNEDVRSKFYLLIKDHLDKELVLNKKGIKVLSLIFLDNVSNYRIYTNKSSKGYKNGPYADIFEQEYDKLINQPKYHKLNDYGIPASEVHEGYFAKDRKQHFRNSKSGESIADDSTYQLIMKDKEKLLTMYNPKQHHISKANKIRFIFSHSALKKGWDNPNIFQILVLNNSHNKINNRQEIGRGLRLAVNQKGQRVPGFGINVLTVIASENYEEFAKKLQHDYEEDGIHFNSDLVINPESFKNIKINDGYIDNVLSQKIYALLVLKGIVKNNHIKRSFVNSLSCKSLYFLEELGINKSDIYYLTTWLLHKLNQNTIIIRDKNKRIKLHPNKNIINNKDFISLWNKIKYKSRFVVNINSNRLISDSIKRLNKIQVSDPLKIITKDKIKIRDNKIVNDSPTRLKINIHKHYSIPNVINYLRSKTHLTGKTIANILLNVDNLDKLKLNPMQYLFQAKNNINDIKYNLMINNIKYIKEDKTYNKSELFSKSIYAYVNDTISVKNKNKTVYNYIVVQSYIEKHFASELGNDDNVKFYLKLPNWFKINTPLGSYNPDWAVVIKRFNSTDNSAYNLYFVADTKGSTDVNQLRKHEEDQLKCGKYHFKALNTNIKFVYPITDINGLYHYN